MTSPVAQSEPVGRWLLVAAGVLLASTGLHRGGLSGAALVFGGGGLIFRGAGGDRAGARRCAAHLAHSGAGVSAGIYDHVAQAAKEERHPAGTLIEDVVEEASDDSFPCSDPPAWTARG